jgi:hypothetical protein
MNEQSFKDRTNKRLLNVFERPESVQALAPSPHSSPVKGEEVRNFKKAKWQFPV